ncbi:MAG: helix-turn-helix transcriptional regulator [bacterium]|nr:helix-turn-helix transcriptional regulator [bacterium]
MIYAYITREKRIELEKLYQDLKFKNRNTENPAITESSKEKLNSIIEFINNNYFSDITREGLAKAVEMSPNYMSNLFKEYTGQKINDYINELRVKSAASKLQEEQAKIINIAFSVGFDSLTTFNRSFKKTMGVTPSQYRSDINH